MRADDLFRWLRDFGRRGVAFPFSLDPAAVGRAARRGSGQIIGYDGMMNRTARRMAETGSATTRRR